MTPPRRPGHHACPGRCGRMVGQHLFACTRCLNRLPPALRAAVDAVKGANTRASLDRRREVMTGVRDWLIEHPAPYDPDHAIAGQCEYCDEALVWLTTASGARLPANADPDPERGNIVRTGKVAGVLGPATAAAARAGGTRLWLHHVVACPFADQWHTPRDSGRRGPDRKARRS